MSLRKKREGRIISKSRIRLSGLEIINEEKGKIIDFGGPRRALSITEFSAQIKTCEALTGKCNQAKQAADAAANELAAAEKILAEMYTEILSGAKGMFGLDSNEVEILGGIRISERKKSRRKTLKAKS